MLKTVESPFLSPEKPTFLSLLKKSALELRSIRSICTLGMLIALCCVLSLLKIPLLGDVLQLKFTYLIYGLTGFLYGPVGCAVLGVGDQIIAETLMSGNGALFGFVLSFAIRGFIFGSLFYYPRFIASEARGRGYLRTAVTKCIDTFVNNIFMNTALLYYYGWITKDAFMTSFLTRAAKNFALLPVEVLLLGSFMYLIIPPLSRLRLIPKVEAKPAGKKELVVAGVLAVLGIAAIVLFILLFPQKA